jgi:hypothetical protein
MSTQLSPRSSAIINNIAGTLLFGALGIFCLWLLIKWVES